MLLKFGAHGFDLLPIVAALLILAQTVEGNPHCDEAEVRDKPRVQSERQGARRGKVIPGASQGFMFHLVTFLSSISSPMSLLPQFWCAICKVPSMQSKRTSSGMSIFT